MGIGRQIREIRKAEGMSQQALGKALGVGRTAVTNWENGGTRPDADMIPRIAEVLHIPVEALFGVADSMPAEEKSVLCLFRRLSPCERETVCCLMEGMIRNRGILFAEKCRERFRRLPRMTDKVCAGAGTPLENPDEGEGVFLRRTALTDRADLLVTVSGDSMEPVYRDGDCLLVSRRETVREGETGIFIVAGEGTVKEYRKDGLYPRNPAYPVLRPAEDDDVRCAGKVLGRADEALFPDAEERAALEERV